MNGLDKDKVLNLLNKFIERAERRIADADDRDDSVDVLHYEGEKTVTKEIKEIISKW